MLRNLVVVLSVELYSLNETCNLLLRPLVGVVAKPRHVKIVRLLLHYPFLVPLAQSHVTIARVNQRWLTLPESNIMWVWLSETGIVPLDGPASLLLPILLNLELDLELTR